MQLTLTSKAGQQTGRRDTDNTSIFILPSENLNYRVAIIEQLLLRIV